MTFLTCLIQSVHYLIQLLFNGHSLNLIHSVYKQGTSHLPVRIQGYRKQIVGDLDLHPMVEVIVMLDYQNCKLSSHEANTMLLLSMV